MMDGDALGDAMRAAVDTVPDKTNREAVFRALGQAIVLYIQANASVAGSVEGVQVGTSSVPLIDGQVT